MQAIASKDEGEVMRAHTIIALNYKHLVYTKKSIGEAF
jgi:hypothetical protein